MFRQINDVFLFSSDTADRQVRFVRENVRERRESNVTVSKRAAKENFGVEVLIAVDYGIYKRYDMETITDAADLAGVKSNLKS